MRRYVLPALILLTFNAFVLAEARWYGGEKSITFDETFYLSCGLQTVHDRWIDPRIAGEGVAPLPVLLAYVPPLLFAERQERPEPWIGEPEDRELIWWPRLINSLVGGVGVVTVVFVWAYRRRGVLAATFAGGLTAISPSLIAHASLATTDATFALLAMLALAALVHYLRQPSTRRLAVLALATAGAMTAKYSGVFLLPTIGIMLFCGALQASEGVSFWKALRSSVARYLVFLCLMFPMWWGLHLFSFTGPLKNVPIEETPDDSPWVKILGRGPAATKFMDLAHTTLKRPAPIAGVLFQFLHNEAGHPAYLMGQQSKTGWWYYFPAAFAFKSTPAELFVACLLLIALATSIAHPIAAFRRQDIAMQVWLVAIGVFVVMLLTSKIAIGHRYLIVLYPLMALAAADWMFRTLTLKQAVPIGVLLLVMQTISNLAIGPHYLAYFNAASGGPERGGELLVDSNIDWGQDLPALRRVLGSSDRGLTAISYFGTADWRAYGVDADPAGQLPHDTRAYGRLAISVTHLQGVYVPGDDPFRNFRGIKPDVRAGYSIVVFNLNTTRRQAMFAEAVRKLRRGIAHASERNGSDRRHYRRRCGRKSNWVSPPREQGNAKRQLPLLARRAHRVGLNAARRAPRPSEHSRRF